MPSLGHANIPGELAMAETTNALAALSDSTAQLVERTARSVVAVHSGGRWPASGIHWRSGIVVTAEEVLERDENIKLTLPGGRVVEATLVGRDPTTDVAVLRFQPNGLPVAATTNAAPLGIVALASGPWHSARGGTIDNFIRLDLALSPVGEGGALVGANGQVMAMTVLGPRHRAIAIPASTIERAVDQLLARGQVFRGYLGAGLRPLGRERASGGSGGSGDARGVLVVSIDPDGPSRRAGLLLGDIVTAWNGKPIDRVREVMHLLGPESVGTTVDLGLTRGGAPAALKVVVGERPVK
jgi:S1-C subfamily serine protease